MDKLAAAGAALCVETLKGLEEHTIVPEKQGDSPTAIPYKKMGEIDWTQSKAIEQLIRGLNSWPSAYTQWDGKVMKIWAADVTDTASGKAPGTVVKKECKDSASFMRGYQIAEEGMMLGGTL